jgi:hypothetical protein
MNYYEQLKDKRWYHKRKKILERDGYKCTVCGCTKDLRVHHTYYYKESTEPWNYPSRSLLTLCDACHTQWHLQHENVYRDKSKPKKRDKATAVKPLTNLEKMTLKYWEVETTSHSGKSCGYNYFYARDKKHALSIMKKKRLPVFHIKEIKRVPA